MRRRRTAPTFAQLSEKALHDIKGGLRPPAGCGRLASVAVLAGHKDARDTEPVPTGNPDLARELRRIALRDTALVAAAFASPPSRRLARWYGRALLGALLAATALGFVAGYLGWRGGGPTDGSEA
jgi:hypothetical protein